MNRAPIRIAIAGGTGSGKSTLAHALCDALGRQQTLLLHHDSYYRDLSHLSVAERAQTNFDHPSSLDNDLLSEHLDLLEAGQSIPAVQYDFVTHTRIPTTERLHPKRFVVVEGILLLGLPALARRFDLRAFVSAPADLRFIRRQHRDVSERGRTWESVCRQYLSTVRPMHEEFVEPSRDSADVVVSGVRDLEIARRSLLTEIEKLECKAEGRRSIAHEELVIEAERLES